MRGGKEPWIGQNAGDWQEEDMAKQEKVAKVEEIRRRFLDNRFVFLTDFTGLTVDEISRLRHGLRAKGADYRVLKNTLTLLAIRGTDFEPLERLIVGPLGAAFGADDPVTVARELAAFARENPNLKIKGGFLEGKVLEAEEARSVATLPPREVLLARITGSLQSPLYGLHGVLSGPCRKLAYALRAVADAKSQAA